MAAEAAAIGAVVIMDATTGLVHALLENNSLKTEEQIHRFVAALNALRANPPDSFVPELFLVFDDSAWEITPLQSLLSFMEKYDLRTYIQCLVKYTPQLTQNAPTWARRIYVRVINHPDCRVYLKQLVQLDIQARERVRDVLRCLVESVEDDPELRKMLRERAEFVLSVDDGIGE